MAGPVDHSSACACQLCWQGRQIQLAQQMNIAQSQLNYSNYCPGGCGRLTGYNVWCGTCPVPKSEPDVAGRKDDAGKLRYTLLPWKALDEVVRVLEHGAAKYGDDNWRKFNPEDGARRYSDAAMRHLVAFMGGERLDAESKRHHLAHAICSLLFVMEHGS